MPSQPHEALLLLFRNRPTLAAELLCDALHVALPAFTEARLDSAEIAGEVERFIERLRALGVTEETLSPSR